MCIRVYGLEVGGDVHGNGSCYCCGGESESGRARVHVYMRACVRACVRVYVCVLHCATAVLYTAAKYGT